MPRGDANTTSSSCQHNIILGNPYRACEITYLPLSLPPLADVWALSLHSLFSFNL